MSHTQTQILTCVPHVSVWPNYTLFSVSKIIHKSIHIFIVAAGAGFHIDSKNAGKDEEKSTRVEEKFGAPVIIEKKHSKYQIV